MGKTRCEQVCQGSLKGWLREPDMSQEKDEYLIEFIQVGTSVKVSAIDPVSGREVSIVGPATATCDQLSRVAINKLKFILSKEKH